MWLDCITLHYYIVLFSNFGMREEYDPIYNTRGKDCVLYLARTDFSQDTVPMTVLLIAEVPNIAKHSDPIRSGQCEFLILALLLYFSLSYESK